MGAEGGVIHKHPSVHTSRVVFIEIFSGILPLSAAAEAMRLYPEATYYIELCPNALAVAQCNFPSAVHLGATYDVDDNIISKIVSRHFGCWFFVVGGPPCTNVSLLQSDDSRAGAWVQSLV